MKKTLILALGVLALAGVRSAEAKKVEVMCVYYPHWHQYPKGTEWFGEKWNEGEWAFVKSPCRRWPGHHNLKPLPGYLNGKDPTDVATEIDLASGNGIDVFLYDYYYYGGKITQQEAIEEGFLKAPNRNRMKFALMWCYHERRDAFRIKIDAPDRFLMKLDHTPEEFLGLIDYSIAHYFNRPEYWRKDGKLFFSIYNAKDFIKYLGQDAAKKALADARAKIRAAGLGEVEFNAQGIRPEKAAEAKALGFDSITDYGFNAYSVRAKRPNDWLFDFTEIDGMLQKHWASHTAHDLPYYPVVPTGWDSTLRCRPEEPFPWKKLNYPYGPSFTNVNPVVFEKYLRAAKEYAENDPKSGGVVYINAWNEYTEGCYLLPTVRTGDQMLRAVGRVFGRRPEGAITSCGMKHWWDPKAKNGTSFTAPAPTFENLKYGPHMRQSMDVWLPEKSAAKTPCLINIHGGGWMDGDRLGGVKRMWPKCQKKGIAFVSISYRMISDGNDAGVKPPVKVCLDDAVAAIDYVKAHAAEWNIDVTRLALTGGSAGACSSLYASLQNDCELGIKVVFTESPQTSLDPQEMKAWIPNSTYGAHAFNAGSFGNWLAHRADHLPWIERFSPAGLLRKCTAAKAPVFLYTCPAVPPNGALPKDPTHAGMFCVKFKEICDAKGIACRNEGLDAALEALVK